MRILAIIGSGRKKGNTYLSVKAIEKRIQSLDANAAFEYLYLSDAVILPCIGCRTCFHKGEACCPHKDDVHDIAEKLLHADGVIFATPTYVCSMSGLMKNLLDRLAYFCHRPAFHGKAALVVTTTGSSSANMAAYTVRLPLGSMGFTVTGTLGITLNTGDIVPVPAKAAKRLSKLTESFYNRLTGKKRDAPTIFSLVSFYMNRRYYKTHQDKESYDYCYFQKNGCLDPERRYYTNSKPRLFQMLIARTILRFVKST